MNDPEIRARFHETRLRKLNSCPNTLVLDELGLKHGKCRADIAVINGHLIGYEIKSDEDSLARLDDQIDAYGDVFDRISIIVGTKYRSTIQSYVPPWWGIIAARQGQRGGVSFETIRGQRNSPGIDSFSVAQLLWKNEVIDKLVELGAEHRALRQRREVLYEHLVDMLSEPELRRFVREQLKNRKNWRHQTQLSQCDDSSQLPAK